MNVMCTGHLGASFHTSICSAAATLHASRASAQLWEAGSHHNSVLLQGFAYVKYNNSISAASAVERYNGFELPAGSGLRLKVTSAAALSTCLSSLCQFAQPCSAVLHPSTSYQLSQITRSSSWEKDFALSSQRAWGWHVSAEGSTLSGEQEFMRAIPACR